MFQNVRFQTVSNPATTQRFDHYLMSCKCHLIALSCNLHHFVPSSSLFDISFKYWFHCITRMLKVCRTYMRTLCEDVACGSVPNAKHSPVFTEAKAITWSSYFQCNYYSHPFHFLVLNMHSLFPLSYIDHLSEDAAFGSVSKCKTFTCVN